ncbi:two-component system, sensor histidine kinase [Burkholderiaceae bacterium]|nr:two-component system, sensor histidine kinase [Burkholderiaceae bacterium]
MPHAALPPSLEDLRQRAQWRLLHLAGGLLVTPTLAFAVFYGLNGRWGLAVTEAIAAVSLLALYAEGRRRRDPAFGLRGMALVTWVLLAMVIVQHGGLHSPALMWMILLSPLLMLAGARLGLVIAGLTIVFVAGLFVAHYQGWLPVAYAVPLAQRALSAVLITTLFGVFAWYSLKWRNRFARELSEARDAAIQAERRQARFIASLNHEIRTPINALAAGARLLARRDLEEEQQSVVKAMERSADHLLILVNDVLDHARLEEGQVQLEAIEFSLRDLLRGVVEMFMPAARSQGIGLTLAISDPLPDVWVGDPTRLRQVLTNLLSNAVKFTVRGDVQLRVHSLAQGESDPLLLIEVKDTGPGMSRAVQERLFVPYQQGDASIARHHGGTGLGLSICRELVTLMKGTIAVESAPGSGSLFRVAVPLRTVGAEATEGAPPPRTLPVELSGSVRVMLVEDDPVNRMIMEATLRDLGAQVLSAEGGQHALDQLPQARVDVILMDCQMAGMDGFTATRRWRERETELGCPRVPVIALTGDTHPEARQACIAAGMDDYLAKPVSASDLTAMIAHWTADLVQNPAPTAVAAAPKRI